MAGSLIKNPGGTVAPSGGYVAGKEKLVKAAASRLAAPGLGIEAGSTSGDVMRLLFQGLFLSPQMVGEAIKVLMIFDNKFQLLGFMFDLCNQWISYHGREAFSWQKLWQVKAIG